MVNTGTWSILKKMIAIQNEIGNNGRYFCAAARDW